MMMDGSKGVVGVGGGGGRVGVGEEDMGDGMQCSDHPYRNNPGGICAVCLQEKLGKLVSSSFPLPMRGSSSSSSSPSFRSDFGVGSSSNGVAGTSLSLALCPTTAKGINDAKSTSQYQEYYARRARIPFLLAKKKKKVMVSSSSSSDRDMIFKRSKSSTTRRRSHFLDAATDEIEEFTPKKWGFWSFLYLASSKPSTSTKRSEKVSSLVATTATAAAAATTTTTNGSAIRPKEKSLGSSLSKSTGDNIVVIEEDDDSPNSQATASAASSFERKVSRSRSVGCGSRSFSGDFFERISTGFGDCTLRRVESQREGKQKVTTAGTSQMKERVRCGGIFGGFVITSSSSSSSSSSYWVSSSADQDMNGKSGGRGPVARGSRSRSWGWAFASPIRAFGGKPSTKDGKSKNATPNLSAIPSLLAVRG